MSGTDVYDAATRSAVMRRVKSRDTTPERIVRAALTRLGARYRLHRKDLPGHPDIVMPGRRLAIFVHGCFWHGHDCPRGARVPKANRDYWLAKVARNRARDAKADAALSASGWRVAVVWECELKPAAALTDRLSSLLTRELCDAKSLPSTEVPMRLFTGLALAASLAASLAVAPALAQAPDAEALMAAQREAMKPLAWMQGRWAGEALATTPAGKHRVLQTERAGPMLDGTVMVVEGKGFDPASKKQSFNALGIISYDPASRAYTFTSYSQGRRGTFPMQVTPQGFTWTIPAGPMKIRYAATQAGGTWRETGEMVRPDGTATPMFEMTVKRLGDSDWPVGGGAVAP